MAKKATAKTPKPVKQKCEHPNWNRYKGVCFKCGEKVGAIK